jgi:hypothetical protein
MFVAMVGLDTHHLAIITGFKLLQVCLHPAQATCHTPLSLVTWKEAKYITHNKGTVMQCLGLTHFCWYYRLHGNVMVLTKTNHLHVPCWPETASSYKTDILDVARHLLWSHHKQYALQNAKHLLDFLYSGLCQICDSGIHWRILILWTGIETGAKTLYRFPVKC